jgi:2-polyprenyl-3-methyl-5-hydroxy-6-metoxy-1,4-benzoquinol methylase
MIPVPMSFWEASIEEGEIRGMSLIESRRRASELSGGTSSEVIRGFVIRMLRASGARGSLVDFGAGRGELLQTLYQQEGFKDLTGIDLFERAPDLPNAIAWYRQDLNETVTIMREFDVAVCSETIEHLENPRHVLRSLHILLRPGGMLILTMPNQESIRSLCGLLFRGHFTLFLGSCYPAHITALVRLDLVRICSETGFSIPKFFYTNDGGIPKLPSLRWQTASAGILRGRLFSDNLGMLAQRIA